VVKARLGEEGAEQRLGDIDQAGAQIWLGFDHAFLLCSDLKCG
jgi:hypothetical protein